VLTVAPGADLAFHGTSDTIVPFNGGKDGIVHALTFPSVVLDRSLEKARLLPTLPRRIDVCRTIRHLMAARAVHLHRLHVGVGKG
jgi:hypothetical protein